jgi:hypothetical protein
MSAQRPQAGETQSVARPVRWPLIILPSNRQEDTNKDARLVNGYLEKEMQGDVWLYKRPGLAQSSRPSGAAGIGRGTYNWLGNVYSVVDDRLYKESTVISGVLDTTNGVYTFTSCMGNGTGPARLILGNGAMSYCYDDANGLIRFDSGFAFLQPVQKGFAYLDGKIYALTFADAAIYGSDGIDDPLTWDILNKIIANIEPSRGIALAKQLVYVIAFKETSTEIFFDAGNALGSPLGRVSGAKINWGCASANSLQEIDGALFWLSTNRSSAIQVMKMDNLKAEIISSPAIERLLGEADFSVIYSWALKYEGHRWYGVTLKNDNLTLVFDLTTGLWSQWTDSNGNYFPFVASTYKTATAQTLLQHETDGYLYTVDSANVSDAGSSITVDIYTPNYDAGTAREKHLATMYFDTNQVPGSTLQVRCTDDDYQTWSNFRMVDLSQKKPTLQNNGTFKRRAYNFRHQSLTRFRIKAVDLQMDIGTL